ncbi:UPF0500 protein C1orf216 homolog [Brachionichthys hirsutus]|uniref:UPF0500 protein C1orf216 homolog n=1 Tax=Brachionichthys hirsutus TaxID=412623 RepID=UPI0036045AEF
MRRRDGESQSRSVMLRHQDQPLNLAYREQGGSKKGSSSSLQNRKCDKDGNFNFLPDKGDEGFRGTGGGGDENRNQSRPHNSSPLGRDPLTSSPHSGIVSLRSRRPCWSPLESLPEIEARDGVYGRVPPDGAEEGKAEEEERRVIMSQYEEVQRHKMEQRRGKSRSCFGGREEDEDNAGMDDDEWGDSDTDSELSGRSGGSMSPLDMDGGGEGTLMRGWDRIGVGEPKSSQRDDDPTSRYRIREPPASRRSFSRRSLTGDTLENLLEEDGRSSDSDGETPELTDAVWTQRDRDHFKAQEMEKHQAQLTMYRRMALIRWVRALQSRIQEQQNRLQSSFDIILTQRKELLRMGSAAVGQS